MIHLIELEALDPATNSVVVERFATHGYTTRRSDDLPNQHFEERIIDPGNIERSIFANGSTAGSAHVSFGIVELANADGGIDRLAQMPVDGRQLTIYALADIRSPWSSRETVLVATMEQIEVTWSKVTIRLRDRMAALAEPVQPVDYAGTTTHGGLNEAEGTDEDLKAKPKPMIWGRVLNVSPVLANRFDLIYQLSSQPLASIDAVRDNGVPLTFAANYSTIAALRTASVPAGRYATALSLGLLRIGSSANGEITVDASEGAAGSRSAAQIARRILDHRGFVAGADYDPATFDALHAANPAEVGILIGTDAREISAVIAQLLASVNGWIVADRLGRFRVGRVAAPVLNPAAPVLDRSIILDKGEGIERLVTQDANDGVPAKKATVRYARNWTVQNKATLDRTAATDAVKAFAIEEYRNADAKDDAVAARHLLAGDVSFDTLLVSEADAVAEAQRRLAIHSVPRVLYRVPIRAEYASGIDLGDTVTLRLDRFDLATGWPALVIGQEVERATGNIRLELWG